MPELPEVETGRRGLEPVRTNRGLAHVDQRRPELRRPFPERFAERLTGRRVTGLTRRSKYLLIGLDGGETWIIHLGMSGRILVESYDPPPYPSPLGGGGDCVARGGGQARSCHRHHRPGRRGHL